MTEDPLLGDLPSVNTVEQSTAPRSDDAAAAAPPTVPGYQILGPLGAGGMGVVYQARQERADRVVALKVMRAGLTGAADRARFRTEGEAIARLRHPHIVQIYEVGERDGVPFFSLEFCGEGSLARRLAGAPLPVAEAVSLVEALAGAVEHAHRAGVVHRDLKPSNILLGAGGVPKVSDFGLAKKLDETGHTATGAVLGTPSYMAPEQARGEARDVGPAADVYALGAILYECLTGRPPFRSATAADTLLQVLHDEPVPPARLQRAVPRDLNTICLKCLHKEPGRRYASAAALGEDLRRFRTGEPILGRPVGTAERAWRWTRRRPLVVGLATVLAVVVLGSVAGLTALWVQGRERAAAEAETRQMFGWLVDSLRAGDPLGVRDIGFYTPSDIGQQTLLTPFLDKAARHASDAFRGDPVTRAELLDLLGDLNRSIGRFDEAEPLLKEALVIRQVRFGDDHPDTALSLHNLAWLHHDRGRYADAEALYRRALDHRLRTAGADASADRTRFNLAWLLTQMGDYAEAEKEFQRVLAWREGRYGKESLDVAIVNGALAAMYLDSGDAAKARLHSSKMAEVIGKTDSEEGLGKVVAAFQAGVFASYLGRHAAAEKHLDEAAKRLGRLLGERHVYMALVLHELASAQEEGNKLNEAEATYRRCIDVTRQSVGLSHPKATVAVASLGALLARRGKGDEADALFADLLEAHRWRFGERHPLVADALVEYAPVRRRSGGRDAEQKDLEEALSIYDASGATRHRLLVRCLEDLALCHYRGDRYADAEALLMRARPLAQAQYGDKHPKYASVLDNLAAARVRQHKTEGVEDLLGEALRIADAPAWFGGPKPAVLDEILADFGAFCLETTPPRLQDAEKYALKRRKEAGDAANRLYGSASDLARVAAATTDADQKERCAAEAVRVLKRVRSLPKGARFRPESDVAFAGLCGRNDFQQLSAAGRERLPPPRTEP